MHFSSETFYRTAGPSHKVWYWNHGLRWQTSLVCRSCGKWHAICSIWLLQCALCWCLKKIQTCCFEVLYSQFTSQVAVGFSKAITTDVSFGVFIINKRNPLFHPFVLFQAMCSGSVWFTWLKCGNHFALLLQCNHCLVFGDFCVISQAFISMLAKRGTVLCLTPFSFVYCYVINQRRRWFCRSDITIPVDWA